MLNREKRKTTKSILLAVVLAIACATSIMCMGCDEQRTERTEKKAYVVQPRMPAMEYSMYADSQILIFARQLSNRIETLQSTEPIQTENELKLTEEAIAVCQKTMDDYVTANPSFEQEDLQKDTTLAMSTALMHLQDYKAQLEQERDTSGYKEVFENDCNMLTELATLYYK